MAQTGPAQDAPPVGGWKFDNSYARLPDRFFARTHPRQVANPQLVAFNHNLAARLGLDAGNAPDAAQRAQLAACLSGNALPPGSHPLAQAYAGHQFGHFTLLGDGRAHLIGEHLAPDGWRVDLQLKGSGKTPFSRNGDGRAALGPMLREYLVSEALRALNIPTTRSLAVVTTGEPVYRERRLDGAILVRIASSHIRIGTFQYFLAARDFEALRQLVDYTIARHFPNIAKDQTPCRALLAAVMERHIRLVVEWLRIGFIHGVMNTDNMSICGETLDYGPCAFLDAYSPNAVFSSIDEAGRYAFGNQLNCALWNLARFAETLVPLMHEERPRAIAMAEEVLGRFHERAGQAFQAMMRRKLGLEGSKGTDEALVADLLGWMEERGADFTAGFTQLTESLEEGAGAAMAGAAMDEARGTSAAPGTGAGDGGGTAAAGGAMRTGIDERFDHWHRRWRARICENEGAQRAAARLMRAANPTLIARNHLVEAALEAACADGNFAPFERLHAALSQPLHANPHDADLRAPPRPHEQVTCTFCGT